MYINIYTAFSFLKKRIDRLLISARCFEGKGSILQIISNAHTAFLLWGSKGVTKCQDIGPFSMHFFCLDFKYVTSFFQKCGQLYKQQFFNQLRKSKCSKSCFFCASFLRRLFEVLMIMIVSAVFGATFNWLYMLDYQNFWNINRSVFTLSWDLFVQISPKCGTNIFKEFMERF